MTFPRCRQPSWRYRLPWARDPLERVWQLDFPRGCQVQHTEGVSADRQPAESRGQTISNPSLAFPGGRGSGETVV